MSFRSKWSIRVDLEEGVGLREQLPWYQDKMTALDEKRYVTGIELSGDSLTITVCSTTSDPVVAFKEVLEFVVPPNTNIGVRYVTMELLRIR